MLTELRIANFALIEQLHLHFQPGFTVLTGETGTGKSLLIDAVGLLVGGRASSDQIRSGEEEAQLEAAFQLPETHPLLRRLRADGAIGKHDSDLVLKRVLSRSGRHRIYLNGGLCHLRTLEELGGTLVDIHGQHEQQSLLSTVSQLDSVDSFGSLHVLRAQYEETYRTWKRLQAERDDIANAGADRLRLQELLRFQVDEIERADLQHNEDVALQSERQRLLHAHRLRELAVEVYAVLQSDEGGVLNGLGRIAKLLQELGQIDRSMEDCIEQVTDASVQLKELTRRIRDYAECTEADPERHSAVEERLNVIDRLKKKYGGSLEQVLVTRDQAKLELQAIEGGESRLVDVTAEIGLAWKRLEEMAKQLSKKRREAATRLTKLVAAELAELKMPQTLFSVGVSAIGVDEFGPTGCDRVEFLLSSNNGESPKPLARIASGGELSRIMLALKTVLAERDYVPVVMFDEIDTGVGGAAAAAMGIRLRRLGAFHQVFCITHLPQVASQADHHLMVEKGVTARRSATSVRLLRGMAREEEIARMLGGMTVTKKVRETAAELIAGAGSQES